MCLKLWRPACHVLLTLRISQQNFHCTLHALSYVWGGEFSIFTCNFDVPWWWLFDTTACPHPSGCSAGYQGSHPGSHPVLTLPNFSQYCMFNKGHVHCLIRGPLRGSHPVLHFNQNCPEYVQQRWAGVLPHMWVTSGSHLFCPGQKNAYSAGLLPEVAHICIWGCFGCPTIDVENQHVLFSAVWRSI